MAPSGWGILSPAEDLPPGAEGAGDRAGRVGRGSGPRGLPRGPTQVCCCHCRICGHARGAGLSGKDDRMIQGPGWTWGLSGALGGEEPAVAGAPLPHPVLLFTGRTGQLGRSPPPRATLPSAAFLPHWLLAPTGLVTLLSALLATPLPCPPPHGQCGEEGGDRVPGSLGRSLGRSPSNSGCGEGGVGLADEAGSPVP